MSDIERLLREDARHPIADDGFTMRVVHALPARAARASPWARPVLVGGAAITGSVLAVVLAPAGISLPAGFQDILQLRAFTPAAVSAIAISLTLLASALVLALDPE
jgi:hypothetical protein